MPQPDLNGARRIGKQIAWYASIIAASFAGGTGFGGFVNDHLSEGRDIRLERRIAAVEQINIADRDMITAIRERTTVTEAALTTIRADLTELKADMKLLLRRE